MMAEEAIFCFVHQGQLNVVTYHYDDAGKPSTVMVDRGDKSIAVDNQNGRWKPCATHSKDLIRWADRQKPTSEFAKQRIEYTRPQLKLVAEDS